MTKKTIQQGLIEKLQARGAKIVLAARTRKYVVMTDPRMEGRFLYLGPSGAFRCGGTVGGSVPVGEKSRKDLLGG